MWKYFDHVADLKTKCPDTLIVSGLAYGVDVCAHKVMNLPFKEKIRRADRDNTINVYISDEWEDVLQDGVWEQFFTEKPEPLTREEKKAWIAQNKGVSVGSDAFFPFGDNIERAHKSGVEYIAEAGGSIRDDHVIMTCDKYSIAMAFTGVRLFHH